MWYKQFLRDVWIHSRLSMPALATVVRKNFNCEFIAEIDFPIGHFMLYTIADADIGSLKSLHTLFYKYLDNLLVKFKQNRMV